jgi:hypothetical protein
MAVSLEQGCRNEVPSLLEVELCDNQIIARFFLQLVDSTFEHPRNIPVALLISLENLGVDKYRTEIKRRQRARTMSRSTKCTFPTSPAENYAHVDVACLDKKYCDVAYSQSNRWAKQHDFYGEFPCSTASNVT